MSNGMDAGDGAGESQQPSLQQLGLFDMDVSAAATADAVGGMGNFPFPLTDQASLFNFHTPSGFGLDPFYGSGGGGGGSQGMLGGVFDMNPGDRAASADTGTGTGTGTGGDGLAMDIGLFGGTGRSNSLGLAGTGRSDSLGYTEAGTLPMMFGQDMFAATGSPTVGGFPAFGAPMAGVGHAGDAGQALGEAETRMHAARARTLNSILYNMSLGGMQNPDGIHGGSIVSPLANIGDMSSMNRFLADAARSAAGGLGHMQALVPPISPISPMFATSAGSAGAAQAMASVDGFAGMGDGMHQAAPTAPRIDQACKMCRRRKVRCDGKRPTCTFCRTKGFACAYEPVAPGGGRKRGRRSKASDAGSGVSSATGSMSAVGTSTHGWRAQLASIRSEGSEASDTRDAKLRRLVVDSDGSDGSDDSGGESSSSESPTENGYLKALSNRQIALPANVGGEQDAADGDVDMQTAESVAAEALASIASDPRNKPADGADTTDAAADEGAREAPVSLGERHMRAYFAYFHPQHPILHRPTFEKAVRDGTVSKVLWLAVQAIAARYCPAASAAAKDGRPYASGRRYARLVRAMLPAATRTPSIEVIQALYLLSEHQYGLGDWLEGSTLWGTAVRMFNQLQLHMSDEAFQFPAYTSHLGLHESAVSPLTCRQSPANYGAHMRRPALSNSAWIARELERRMRWVLFESERMHTLAGGTPPLVTLEAGWVHMPCSDAIWETRSPRRAAEYERMLLHMGRYYVDTGGSLRIDMAGGGSGGGGSAAGGGSDSAAPSQPASRVASRQAWQDEPGATPSAPNRVASMLVSVRRRKNRIHLKAHTAIVIGQMTRARMALFRLFFPCRWPSQLMAASSTLGVDEGGGGGAPGPVVLAWDERLRRLRLTVADIDAKLTQWRVYLESMFPLRDHEEGSGRSPADNHAIHRDRVEYANYRILLAALLLQNRATVLQLHACLSRRERKLRHAADGASPDAAHRALASHVLPNQPGDRAMRALAAYAADCWAVIVRQACEIEDLLESHWQVRVHPSAALRVMAKPDWHAADAIRARVNADANLRRYPEDPVSGHRRPPPPPDAPVYFSHDTPPYPLLVPNYRLLDAVVKAADAQPGAPLAHRGAELALASSMNSNIHIETNANARDLAAHLPPPPPAARHRRMRINTTDAGEVDFESPDDCSDADEDAAPSPMDPFRMQLTGTSYFIFLAAKTMIMYLHHAKMSAYILARRRTADAILPSSSVSDTDADADADAGAPSNPDALDDLSPPPQLRTLADIRRMQDRLEIVLTALRHSQKYWMPVDYYVLCARKLRNMAVYGPWRHEDPVSTDLSAELVNGPWPAML